VRHTLLRASVASVGTAIVLETFGKFYTDELLKKGFKNDHALQV